MSAVAEEVQAEVPTDTDMRPQKLGAMIDCMYEIRDRRQDLERESKKLGEELKALEALIIEKQDDEETTMSRGKLATAILTETVIPKVDDWDGFYQYILENEAFHLLQRRTANTACRETLEAGEPITGVTTFTKRAISLRKN